MYQEKLLEKFIQINSEEQAILDKKIIIDRSIFKDDGVTVDVDKLLLTDKQISVRKHTRFVNYPKHRHNFIEMCYVLKGHLTNIINGHEVVLHEGDLLMINQNVEHEILASSESDLTLNFIMRPVFFLDLLNYIGQNACIGDFIINSLYQTHESHSLVYRQELNETQENCKIEELLFNIITTIQEDNEMSMLKVKFYMGLLVIELIEKQDYEIKENTDNNYKNSLVLEIMHYIEEYYQNATLNSISKKLHQNDYSISKLLKQKLGLTFKELLQNKRLEVATRLLSYTNLPIVEICSNIGYENVSYFYKLFHKKYSQSPKEYRDNKE